VITSKVKFRLISYPEIEDYIDSGEPFDKAGSYAIQGKARKFVKCVEGDVLNVIGLPIRAITTEFRKQRWNVSRRKKTSRGFGKNKKR